MIIYQKGSKISDKQPRSNAEDQGKKKRRKITKRKEIVNIIERNMKEQFKLLVI